MKNRSYFRRQKLAPRTESRRPRVRLAAAASWLALCAVPASASEPPDWMRALAGAVVPDHDEKANAVVMYSEAVLTVQSNGKLKRVDRIAYRILRPDGERLGTVRSDFDDQSPITDVHGWSIPPSGKYFEV